jgi:hypothetical protein
MHRDVGLIACRSHRGIQVLDQEQHAAEDGRRHIDFQIIRVGEVCWTIQALSARARAIASREFTPSSQEHEEYRIMAGYVESLAFLRYLRLRGFSIRSGAFEMQER